MKPISFSFLPLVLLVLAAPSLLAADVLNGEQIYAKKCAYCHGANGQGAKKFPKPLIGDRSVAQLATQIAKTMPEDDPGTLSAEDAKKVSAYMHDKFYSQAAQERNKPPRIDLARLTVRQYRNAVADLIGGFRTPAKWDDQRGLKAEYFKSRRFNNADRVVQRTDPEVKFDFGVDAPAPGKMEPHEFSIRWNGSLLAPETGEYEFIVKTEHATRLWVNDLNKPLIDAWVKSGNDTEYRGTIFLVGGRVYPVKLDYSKAKQGVDDSKKNTTKPPPVKSSIALEWKVPNYAAATIPSRNLSPNPAPENYIVTTPFPPDDRSYGWERGTTVSKAWDTATTDAALDTAVYVAAKLNELAGTRDGAGDRDAKVKDFCRRFAERAFRRPLSNEQKSVFIDSQFAATKDVETAVKRVALLVLKSPRFLYREVGGGAEQYDVASRLSFGLWDSLPDQELLTAAAAGKLSSRDEIVKQAERMLKDVRGRDKVHDFLLTWLKLDQPPDVAKDPKRYAGFDQAVISDLRTSLELFLDDVTWSDTADFRRLLLGDQLHFNGRLAKFYGASLKEDAAFQPVKLNPEQRAGVLTHPYLMAAFAYTGETSPIHRGVFLARGILGLSMRPPPDAVTPVPPELHPMLSTRERVTLQTRPANCMSCHAVINPLGFTLEHFDAVGRYREKDKTKMVDSSGSYQTRDGTIVKFTGVRDLAKFLANSEEVHDAFVEQLFHHLVQQPLRAYGTLTAVELRQAFAGSGFNMRKLAVEIMAVAALPPPRASQK